jgi:hypothetical protein
MKYKSEQQIMKKLGIESWRNLSKDKVVKFAAMMSDMDKEVMLKVIDQFPEFTKYANDLLTSLHETLQKSMDMNSSDYQASLEIIKETQSIYKDLLVKDDITTEERLLVINKLSELTKMVEPMDKENKKFYKFINSEAVKTTAVALGTAIVILGGKVIVDSLLGGDDNLAEDDAIDVDYEEI